MSMSQNQMKMGQFVWQIISSLSTHLLSFVHLKHSSCYYSGPTTATMTTMTVFRNYAIKTNELPTNLIHVRGCVAELYFFPVLSHSICCPFASFALFHIHFVCNLNDSMESWFCRWWQKFPQKQQKIVPAFTLNC